MFVRNVRAVFSAKIVAEINRDIACGQWLNFRIVAEPIILLTYFYRPLQHGL